MVMSRALGIPITIYIPAVEGSVEVPPGGRRSRSTQRTHYAYVCISAGGAPNRNYIFEAKSNFHQILQVNNGKIDDWCFVCK